VRLPSNRAQIFLSSIHFFVSFFVGSPLKVDLTTTHIWERVASTTALQNDEQKMYETSRNNR
jgi:hypothetical protein